MMFLPALLPKAACLGWDSSLVWSQAAADFVTMLAYFILPLVLLRTVSIRPAIHTDATIIRMYFAWAAFIFCGGLERGSNILILWWPDYYYLQTVAKWITASVTLVSGAFIATPLLSALQLRESRLTKAETQIHTLTKDVVTNMQTLAAHRAGALEQAAYLEKYIQEQRLLAVPPSPEVLATLAVLVQKLRKDLAEA